MAVSAVRNHGTMRATAIEIAYTATWATLPGRPREHGQLPAEPYITGRARLDRSATFAQLISILHRCLASHRRTVPTVPRPTLIGDLCPLVGSSSGTLSTSSFIPCYPLDSDVYVLAATRHGTCTRDVHRRAIILLYADEQVLRKHG